MIKIIFMAWLKTGDFNFYFIFTAIIIFFREKT